MIFIFTFLFIFFHSFMYNKSLQLYWKEKRIDYAFGYLVSMIIFVYLIWRFNGKIKILFKRNKG